VIPEKIGFGAEPQLVTEQVIVSGQGLPEGDLVLLFTDGTGVGQVAADLVSLMIS